MSGTTPFQGLIPHNIVSFSFVICDFTFMFDVNNKNNKQTKQNNNPHTDTEARKVAELRDRFEKIASANTKPATNKPRVTKFKDEGEDNQHDGAEKINGSNTLSKASTVPKNVYNNNNNNPNTNGTPPGNLRKATSEVNMIADNNSARLPRNQSMVHMDSKERMEEIERIRMEELERIRSEELDKIRAQEHEKVRKENEEHERRHEERERQWKEETERMRVKHEEELESIRKQERERIIQEERDRVRNEERERLHEIEEERERIRQEERARVRQELEEETRRQKEQQVEKTNKVQEDDRLWWEDQVRREAEEEAVSRLEGHEETAAPPQTEETVGEEYHEHVEDVGEVTIREEPLHRSHDSITDDSRNLSMHFSLNITHTALTSILILFVYFIFSTHFDNFFFLAHYLIMPIILSHNNFIYSCTQTPLEHFSWCAPIVQVN